MADRRRSLTHWIGRICLVFAAINIPLTVLAMVLMVVGPPDQRGHGFVAVIGGIGSGLTTGLVGWALNRLPPSKP